MIHSFRGFWFDFCSIARCDHNNLLVLLVQFLTVSIYEI